MIEAKITGFEVTSLIDFFKNYKGFKTINLSKDWQTYSNLVTNDFTKLYIFIYTNFMARISRTITITVLLEFISNSEVNLNIISTGGQDFYGNSWDAEEHCEHKIFDSLNKDKNHDWIIKELSPKL